jgi:nitronate monooxygenase
MATAGRRISVADKTCLCTQMRRFKVWTCGHFTWRLKDTVRRDEDGEFVLPSAREVFLDYLHGRPRDRGDAPPP